MQLHKNIDADAGQEEIGGQRYQPGVLASCPAAYLDDDVAFRRDSSDTVSM
jgi:hypothetical protein